MVGCKIINIHGIGRFERKAIAKLKSEVLSKYSAKNVSVFCCYDSDVFEFAQKPPTNWKLVEKEMNILSVNSFSQIVAIHMIEDWFLQDIEGISKYLKISIPTKLPGNNGNEKMKVLFRKGNKIYQKGSYTHKFLEELKIEKILSGQKDQFKQLEQKLNYKP